MKKQRQSVHKPGLPFYICFCAMLSLRLADRSTDFSLRLSDRSTAFTDIIYYSLMDILKTKGKQEGKKSIKSK